MQPVWAFGGVSGSQVRPFALHALAAIKAALPDMPVLACGGICNAKTALEFIHLGAPAVQVCSASMHHGFGLVDQMMEGLKYQLYIHGRADLRAWGTQYPPVLRAIRAPRRFGRYEEEHRKVGRTDFTRCPSLTMTTVQQEIEECLRSSLPSPKAVAMLELAEQHGRVVAGPPATMQQEIGVTLASMRPFHELSTDYHTVSSVDAARCVGCGRCQIACMDAGYAAIAFDRTTRTVKINPSCKGCGLCVAVWSVQLGTRSQAFLTHHSIFAALSTLFRPFSSLLLLPPPLPPHLTRHVFSLWTLLLPRINSIHMPPPSPCGLPKS